MESDQVSLSIPSLHAYELIWSQRTLKKLQSSEDIQEFSILNNLKNANSKFKDPFLRSHIKPDYGSLGEFMTNIDINKDFMMQKKKKNQGQEQYEQKKIRNLLKNKNLDLILKSPSSNPLQRSVACKIMIQRIFQQAFGSDINQFYAANNKVESTKKKPININNLSEALDKALQKQQQNKYLTLHEGLVLNNKNIRKKKSFLTKDEMRQNQKQDKMKKIEQLKNNYRSLIKYQICTDNQQIQLLKNVKVDQEEDINKKVKIFKTFQEQNFQLSQTILKVQYFDALQPKAFLNILTKINYETIEIVQIKKSTVPQDLIFLLCDLLVKFSKKLKVLSLEQLSLKSHERLSYKIKQIFESNNLTHVKLNKLGLQTKDFCVICLGIGYSRQLQSIQMKDNNIDQSGKKSYDVIVKFFRNMQFNIQGNLLARQVNKLKPSGSKAFIK